MRTACAMLRNKLVSVYLPSLDGGGAQRVVSTLVNAMADDKLRVDLVLAKAVGPFFDEIHEGVRVVDLSASRVSSSLPNLVRYLRRERPFALLSSLNYVNVIALLARAIARVETRVVVCEHNTLSHSHPDGLHAWVLRRLMRAFYPRADAVVAVSHGVADDLSKAIKLERGKIRVIYNPVVRPEIMLRAHEPVDHPWFQQGMPPVLLGIGRLEEQKDFTNLIRAFKILQTTRDARLVILGEGALRSHLEALIGKLGLSKNVLLPGFVANPYSFLSKAAVFVLSSRWEGLPTVLIEAMACGVPVVATDCPSGPSEILEDGRWGRLVPVGDSVALAGAIRETLDEHDRPDVRSRASEFEVQHAVMHYLDVLKL
jgi:glycosyltransferase involved in cell wall biosynthesis